MELIVNGERRMVSVDATVAEVMATVVAPPPGVAVTALPRGVAVAVNGEVVPRAGWPDTVLCAGDRVEVLTAAQGG